MAERTTYTCDECGKTKGESNHWYRALIVEQQVAFGPWNSTLVLGVESRKPVVNMSNIPKQEERHLCGQACAIQLLSKTIGANRA